MDENEGQSQSVVLHPVRQEIETSVNKDMVNNFFIRKIFFIMVQN